MIYTVTFNPALDYVLELDSLDSADINRSKNEDIYFGGKGINVSAILSRLGDKNKALGFVAGFTGNRLDEMLRAEGIDTDFICLKNGHTRINVKLKADRELDVNAKGPDIDEESLKLLFDKLNALESGDYLILAGSIPSSLPSNTYQKILDMLDGRGVNTVVDAEGELLLNVLKYKPFLIKPNHHELGELFGVQIKELVDIISYAKRLQQMGAKNVLVSRGGDGAMLIDEQGNVHTLGAVPGKIVSSVGCGDSIVAGFVSGYISTNDYSHAFKLGCACGNASAFSPKLATKQEIDDMMINEYLN